MSKKEVIFEIFKGIIAILFWCVLIAILYIILDPLWNYDYPFGAEYAKYVFYTIGMFVSGYGSALLVINLFYNR